MIKTCKKEKLINVPFVRINRFSAANKIILANILTYQIFAAIYTLNICNGLYFFDNLS